MTPASTPPLPLPLATSPYLVIAGLDAKAMVEALSQRIVDDKDVEVRVDKYVGDGVNVEEYVGDGDGDGLGGDDYEVGYAESICEGDEFMVDEAELDVVGDGCNGVIKLCECEGYKEGELCSGMDDVGLMTEKWKPLHYCFASLGALDSAGFGADPSLL
ncbi:hypothetical protein Tco_0276207 [Tanacetum coccineum]